MAHEYLRDHGGARTTPQSEPIPGSDQVPNTAGGHAWAVDCWTRLRRFLVLGSEGGTYYIGQRDLTNENIAALQEALKEDGPRAVELIAEVSEGGLAAQNDPAVYALAVAAKTGDAATRRAALEALPRVCRIGTHLFHFAEFVELYGGWSRGVRGAVARWYGRDVAQVAYQAVKYRQRDGWTHRDLLRLCHARPQTPDHAALFSWVTDSDSRGETGELPAIVSAYELAQASADPAMTAELVGTYPDLPREALNPDHLSDARVWEALLLGAGMPMTALVRNLATMTRVGLLTPGSDGTQSVVAQLGDAERLRKARVHPFALLMALRTYAQGHGFRGSAEWVPVPRVVDALDAAFYAAFENVEPTDRRHLLALDVSGSMGGQQLMGSPVTAREGAAAMALVTAAAEPAYETVAFTGGMRYGLFRRQTTQRSPDAISPLAITPRQRLDDVVRLTAGLDFGPTDCALPMLWATENEREVDAFLVYTDSETWCGDIHPAQALAEYRRQSGIDARLVVVGMTSNGFSIADPDDAGMLDVVGFDASAPRLISEFVSGRV